MVLQEALAFASLALRVMEARKLCLHDKVHYHIIIIIIMALQHFIGPWHIFQFLDPIHSR
jgi:hypothetical protein